MAKQHIIAMIAIFIVWTGLDMLIHGVLLMPTYEATASLWRPEAEMKVGIMYAVSLAFSAIFVCIYACFVGSKSLKRGIQYGTVFGLGAGVIMFGFYSYMPIPLSLGISWFVATLVELIIAGVLVGWLVKQ